MLSKIVGGGRNASDRRRGNQCRDARDWQGAAQAYARHLATNSSDQPIWVQLGHALKEQGLLEEAADAYRTAVGLNDRDADANIHLADILRRLGRGDDALAAYERVNDIAPNFEAMQQIRLLRQDTTSTSATELGSGTIFFAIQDFFGYLKAHVTMSGIQRVQAGIAMHAIQDASIDARFILSAIDSNRKGTPSGEFWMVDNAQLMRVIQYASGEHVNHDTLRAMLMRCEDDSERVRPIEGSTVILLGAFWGLGNSVQHFVPSKKVGVRIGAYVYDIIPVTHPEFCDDALVTDFSMAICELCVTADFILTISDATRIALTNFIEEHGGRPIPMETVPLAHHLTREADVTWPAQLQRVRGKRYVTYVSTIEGRKNHLYVVNAWRRLIAEGVAVPDLVLVGRHGWKINALTDVLKATSNLNGRLHIAHNLSDGELNAVYAGCEFSVFTSFVEGWGLPIGESLYHGRPCVASGTSSMPEVGGDLVDYVDPLNLTQGIEVFRRMITDRAYLKSRAQAIHDHFVARTWDDVGADFLRKVKLHQHTPVVPFLARLGEGESLILASSLHGNVNLRNYFKKPSRILVDSSHLYDSEDHGVWLRGSSPAISIATDMMPGTSVLAYIQCSIAPYAHDCYLTIFDQVSEAETAPISLKNFHHRGSSARVPLQIGEDGALHLRFNILGTYESDDHRDFALGLRSIGFARTQNAAARQELIETMFLADLTA